MQSFEEKIKTKLTKDIGDLIPDDALIALIEKKHIIKYEDHLKAGRYLLVVNGSLEDLRTADSILSDTKAEGLHLHTEAAA